MSHESGSLAARIYATSHLTGSFRLRSGVISPNYFDKYLFEGDPILLRDIAEEMASLVPSGVDALAGLELGGVPLTTMLSQVTGIPALFVRKAAKDYGTEHLAEGGPVKGRRLLIVEDVVTSGGQILKSVRALRDRGALIAAAVCVIDRELAAVPSLAAAGVELRAMLTMEELKAAGGG